MVFNRRGSIWDEFDREFAEMERMMDRMMQNMRQFDWSNMPANQPIYYGVSVDVGPDGVPRVQQFGNVRPGQQGALQSGVREPFVTTVLDEQAKKVRVTAEMPGIDKRDISLQVAEDALHIHAEGEDRRYEKTLRLQVPVDADSAKARYNNGILEVALDLKSPDKPKGKNVKID